jgi:hypothetical protein
MLKDETTVKKEVKPKRNRKITGPINDGMNTPVLDATVVHIPSEIEAGLLKQAENPLGDPNKI